MAFKKITEADMQGKGNVGRPDTPGVSTAEMQRILDELPREVVAPIFNQLVDALEARGGAAGVGAEAPEGVTPSPAPAAGEPATVQAVLQGLQNYAAAHTARADNPHGVTAAQAGAYTKAETDAQIGRRVADIGAGDMARAVYDPAGYTRQMLPVDGEGKNVTVAFVQAAEDADIAGGETLAVLFGKVKKRLAVLSGKFSDYMKRSDYANVQNTADSTKNVAKARGLQELKNDWSATTGDTIAAIKQANSETTELLNANGTPVLVARAYQNAAGSTIMPVTGGTFTGAVAASQTADYAGPLLRNVNIVSSAGVVQSTCTLVAYRQ